MLLPKGALRTAPELPTSAQLRNGRRSGERLLRAQLAAVAQRQEKAEDAVIRLAEEAKAAQQAMDNVSEAQRRVLAIAAAAVAAKQPKQAEQTKREDSRRAEEVRTHEKAVQTTVAHEQADDSKNE